MANNYTAENIRVLEDIAHIQMRSGMYIGDNGAFALISEVLDNAIDEVQAGYSKEVKVQVNTKENSYTVTDYGRGIPHGTKELDGEQKEILEILMTKANSGGKFDNDAYLFSSGLHGVGITVVNALSEYLHITSHRDGKYVSAYSERGVIDISKGPSKLHGTVVRFKPNPKYFENPVIDLTRLKNRCSIANALGYTVKLFVDGEEITIPSNIYDLMADDKSLSTYSKIPVIDVESSNKEKMKVALKYTSDTKDKYWGYTNLLDNSQGGTHVTQLSKTIIEAWEELLATNKSIKPSVTLKKTDYLVGLRAVCAVFISNPEFSSQTKEKLVVKGAYLNELMDLFKSRFKRYMNANLDVANALVHRFEEYRIAQNALLNRKEISSLIKINNDDSNSIRTRSVVSKLIECSSRKRDERELYIVEGDSAASPFKSTRDTKTQAIIPLRGKILNCTNLSIKDCVKNKEVCDIANSIGAGIGEACDASKSRYGKIIISADADPDGLQITCLVLAMFLNCFPDLVREGKVYITDPPLYCWEVNGKFEGCMNIEDVPKDAKNMHRIKGLGEFNDDQLEYFLVNKTTRRLLQVEWPTDLDEFNTILGSSEGKNELLKSLNIIVSE